MTNDLKTVRGELLFIADGCLVPPDGGSPDIYDAMASAKRALIALDRMIETPAQPKWENVGKIIPNQVIETPAPQAEDNQTSSEWFFRWIARGKGGYAGMTMDRCADMIWHHPDNPYKDNNPWVDDAAPTPAPTEKTIVSIKFHSKGDGFIRLENEHGHLFDVTAPVEKFEYIDDLEEELILYDMPDKTFEDTAIMKAARAYLKLQSATKKD